MFNFFKKNKVEKQAGGIGPEEAQLLINSINDTRSRIAQAISGGYDFADTLHNIYLDFGYPQNLSFFNFWNMYRRFGIAKNVVELPADTMWMRNPSIESENEQFEREFESLVDQLSFWVRMKGVDTRQRIGRYGALFMRVRDGMTPDKPIDSLNGISSIMQIVPLNEGQLQVLETDSDPMSERYGLPKMYHFNGGEAGNRNDQIANSFSIHPDRVIVISEDADNGGIYGMSSLEACYNSLMDLRKILGGGGEGFYKNAAQSIVFNLQDGASAKANEALLNKFNEQYDEFARNRFRRAMWTPGMDAKTLDSELRDPKEFFFNALYDVSAASKIPATILIGQQTGRLASSEDSRAFLSAMNSRAANFGTDAIKAVLDWMIFRNVLPAADYSVEWPDLLALSQEEQLVNADLMSAINEKQFRSGGVVPFDGEEIREAAGLEMREDMEPVWELDDGGEENGF
jgi:hypothetical protein